jgi:hypothetical protein
MTGRTTKVLVCAGATLLALNLSVTHAWAQG